jgi:tRNA A-37 threonylcarbamoyl transferase component Bud32
MSKPKFKEEQKQKAILRQICGSCGKPVTNVGAMTSWIMSGTRCKCAGAPQSPEISPNQVNLQIRSQTDGETGSIDRETASTADMQQNEGSSPFGTRYRVHGVIGQGAMGIVYSVHDTQLKKDFAIKVLNSELAKNKEAVKRFQHEAESVKELSHSNIVSVYDQGMTDDGLPVMVMDLIDGQSLDDLLRSEKRLDLNRTLDILIQVCEALEYAHAAGVVHRDLKPGNIMITNSPEGHDLVKVVDFGIAKVKGNEDRQTRNLTQTGEIFGSPNYMSPEQCLGLEVDARSDLYSLGCMMFECIAGKTPYSGDNAIQIVAQHIGEKLPSLGDWRMRVPSSVDMVIKACLAKDITQRYSSAAALKRDLQLIGEGKEPIRGLVGWQPNWLWRRGGALAIDASIVCLLTFFAMDICWAFFTLLFWGPGGSLDSLLFQASQFPQYFIHQWTYFLFDNALTTDPVHLIGQITYSASAITHTAAAQSLSADELLAQTFGPKSVSGIVYMVLTLLCNWLYHAILQSSRNHSTVGERLLGLKLVDASGKGIDFGQATTRHFAKLLNLLMVFDLIRFAAAWKRSKSLKTAAKQILQQPIHDRLSGCFMIKQGTIPRLPFRSKKENK